MDAADLYRLTLDGEGYLLDGKKENFKLNLYNIPVLQADGTMRTEKLLAKPNTDKNETLHLILAFSQKNLGLTEDAIKTLQTASKLFPNNTRVITPLIDFLVENGQSVEYGQPLFKVKA